MKKVFHVEAEQRGKSKVSLYLINLYLGRGLFDFTAEQDLIHLPLLSPALLTYRSLSSRHDCQGFLILWNLSRNGLSANEGFLITNNAQAKHSSCDSLFSQLPSYAVTTKKFSYLLVKTGTLMLKARSDLRGYIPGQVIKLATEIHNKSGKDTGCVLASLIQVDY